MSDVRGEPERHLPIDELEAGLERLWMPSDAGAVELVVARAESGRRGDRIHVLARNRGT